MHGSKKHCGIKSAAHLISYIILYTYTAAYIHTIMPGHWKVVVLAASYSYTPSLACREIGESVLNRCPGIVPHNAPAKLHE